MNFFTNKHVIAAMVIAPLLAVASYYLVDQIVKEQPHAAVAGQSYELIAKSNCRYTSGECDLVNSSFKSTIRVNDKNQQRVLTLDSSHPLDGVTVGFLHQQQQSIPAHMQVADENSKSWSLPVSQTLDQNTKLRIVIAANGVNYFAETGLVFAQYETSFEKNF